MHTTTPPPPPTPPHPQVGFLFTYVAPLVFVVAIALLKEAYDDFQRYIQDKEANSEEYEAYFPEETIGDRVGPNDSFLRNSILSSKCSHSASQAPHSNWVRIQSKDIMVGMILRLHTNQRVPADCILLRTSEKDGSFIRTDQLDGETDWKLRLPIPIYQEASSDHDALQIKTHVWSEEPHQRIYDFIGSVNRIGGTEDESVPLSLENTLWANCVLATGTVLCVVVYTGKETRAALNANQPKSKAGLIDLEVNFLAKLLFILCAALGLIMVAFQNFQGEWYVSGFRFTLLFSSIIPISLRVNLDMGKAWYSILIQTDKVIEGVQVRNSNLPEELGRIGYLFSDKTGTLTKNEMVFKKLFVGTEVPKGWLHSDCNEMTSIIKDTCDTSKETQSSRYTGRHSMHSSLALPRASGERGSFTPGDTASHAADDEESDYDFARAVTEKQTDELFNAITALAVTHNVTPVIDPDTQKKIFQASSPDEVALVMFAEQVGLALQYRDRYKMSICGRVKTLNVMAGVRRNPITTLDAARIEGTSNDGGTQTTSTGINMGSIETTLDDFGYRLSKVTLPSNGQTATSTPQSNMHGQASAYSALEPYVGWYITKINGVGYDEESHVVAVNDDLVALSDTIASADASDTGSVGGKVMHESFTQTTHEVTPLTLDEQLTMLANNPVPEFQVTLERRLNFEILMEFPFTSESKRMGIVIRNSDTQNIHLFMKGADTKMAEIIAPSPWLEEECSNLAREGLRTLVFGAKRLTQEEYNEFFSLHKLALKSRDPKRDVEDLRVRMEKNLELVGMTGVEDKLQDDVCKTLEHLRNAGIRVWMLTGDKVETAICIARSTRLVSKDGGVFPADCEGLSRFDWLWERELGRDGWRPGVTMTSHQHALDYIESFNRFVDHGSRLGGYTMVVDGNSLHQLMQVEEPFVDAAGKAASVVVARCSPTQKAEVVEIMKRHAQETSKVRTAAIGDGGNDVSMILAAHVGLGIEGKEGRHASLAADYSLIKFSHCLRLITWHGRNSYKRSARLAQFVIHRGLIISMIQAIFSALYYFVSVPIYTGWLLVGYSTVYTMLPAFALVLDEDVTEQDVNNFPELYKELHKSRSLNTRTFLQWVCKAIYQGGIIMLAAIYLFEVYFLRIVTITFTALILTELVTVWLEMHIRPALFVVSELLSILVYIISFFFLESLDLEFVENWDFWWKTTVITTFACAPVYLAKVMERLCCESSHAKLRTFSNDAQSQPLLGDFAYKVHNFVLSIISKLFVRDNARQQPRPSSDVCEPLL